MGKIVSKSNYPQEVEKINSEANNFKAKRLQKRFRKLLEKYGIVIQYAYQNWPKYQSCIYIFIK